MRKSRGYWQTPSNVKNEIDNFISTYGHDNFNWTFLQENKLDSLALGVTRNWDLVKSHYPDLKGLKSLTKPRGYFTKENVIKECGYLIDKYGCFPPKEILAEEGLNSLRNHVNKIGGMVGVRKMFNLASHQSNLEQTCKSIFDQFIDSPYLDNGRKSLTVHGINLQNPESKQWLEVDRFYINERVAIEIQGKQHYSTGGDNSLWDQNIVDRTKANDKLKKQLLDIAHVYLIEIPYTKVSTQFILNSIKECKRFKI